jgi:hypothetical protein
MFASVRALLSGIIDYAGMFPPAKLPLEEAIRNYARYRTEPESWMLGRFICPLERLRELEPFLLELFQNGPPLQISALGRSGTSLVDDLKIAADFNNRYEIEKLATVDGLELRLPEGLFGSAETELEKTSVIDLEACRKMDTVAPANLPIFFELPLTEDWQKNMTAFAGILFCARASKNSYASGGLKIRCGGMEPSAFPSRDQVASIITTCRDKGLPLKATAGLHHPMRHFDPEVQVHMHGFLNVFIAGVLTFANRRTEKEVQAIIEDEDPKDFVFDEEGLRWKTYRAKTAQIEKARKEFITSFGSCSFDEPRDDLRGLGLMT